MALKKQIIDEIFKCYSVNAITVDGETKLIFAGEGPGVCSVYGGPDFADKTTIWDVDDALGGTMSVVTVPDYEDYFFVSKGFHSMVDSETSGVYLLRHKNGKFVEQRFLDIPYLHRFDIFTFEDKRYFLGASLHSGKTDKEDWQNPGKLYIAELPMDLDQPIQVELKVLKDGLYKNHGFNKGQWDGKEAAFVACEAGVMAVMPPQADTGNWQIEHIFSHPVSDVAAMDMDGDGDVEFALLSPFHGNRFDVYKKVDGAYKSVFQYDVEMDFYHAIFADSFNGVPTFVIGARKDDMQLFMVQYNHKTGAFESTIIDSGVGPSNARIIHTKEGDLIMSANRQIGEAAIYRL